MTHTKLDVFNRALSLIGVGRLMSSPDEQTPEGEHLRLWYKDVRQGVLSAAWWPSARKSRRLPKLLDQVEEQDDWRAGDPPLHYKYAYAVPTDFLWPRRLMNGEHFELYLTDKATKAIATNAEDPLLEFTIDQPRVDLWETELRQAIEFSLASVILSGLKGNLAFAERMRAEAGRLVAAGQAASGNTDNIIYEHVPGELVARGYYYDEPQTKFRYPFGALTLGGLASKQLGRYG